MGMTLLLCYMLRNDAFDAVYFVPAESGLWNEEKKTMNQQPITSLKGIGEKTAKLFAKLGVETVEELLHDYPRAYDAYEEPVPIGKLREKEMFAVSGQLMKTPSVRRFKNIQVIITDVRDMTGALQLTWYNMPYLRNVLQMGQILIFRGRVVKKSGRLTMEQPDVFTPEQYRRIMHSMQPVYGQTKGLGNKAITRAVQQALEQRQMEREYLPEELRSRYELAEYNYAIEHIHFPADKKELLFARKRLVFDEFLFFLLSVRRLKEKRQDLKSKYVTPRAPEVDKLLASLPYELTGAQKKVLEEVRKGYGERPGHEPAGTGRCGFRKDNRGGAGASGNGT